MNTETVCGLKNSYIEAYLGTKEAAKVIPEWEKLERRRVSGFNVFAFLFSFFWCFHKKMYREFAVLFAAFLILPVIVGGIAGMSRMEGGLTPKAVYSELRRIPVDVIYAHEYSVCIYGRESVEDVTYYTPWYEFMLMPLSRPNDFYVRVHSEPAFYFAFFRMMTILIINIFCGLYFNNMYFQSTRRKILRQLADMRSDDENSRMQILQRAGRENSRIALKMKPEFVFALMCVVMPVFYDAICIMYNYRSYLSKIY